MLTTVTSANWPQRYNAFKKAQRLFQVKNQVSNKVSENLITGLKL